MAVRIRCINKSGGYHENPHEAVSYYGWVEDGSNKTGKYDRQTMVNWVKSGGYAYVVDLLVGSKVGCIVKTSVRGTEFLQTQSDGKLTNNLLELLECL